MYIIFKGHFVASCGVCSLFVLAFGNLNNGTGNAGLSNLNGNNGLTNANWNILARQSWFIKTTITN